MAHPVGMSGVPALALVVTHQLHLLRSVEEDPRQLACHRLHRMDLDLAADADHGADMLRHHTNIVGDEHDRHPLIQAREEFIEVILHGRVETGRRLVEKQEFRA